MDRRCMRIWCKQLVGLSRENPDQTFEPAEGFPADTKVVDVLYGQETALLILESANWGEFKLPFDGIVNLRFVDRN